MEIARLVFLFGAICVSTLHVMLFFFMKKQKNKDKILSLTSSVWAILVDAEAVRLAFATARFWTEVKFWYFTFLAIFVSVLAIGFLAKAFRRPKSYFTIEKS